MSLEAFVYSLLLAVLGGVVAILICDRRKEAIALLAAFALSYGARWALVYLNNTFEFLPQKLATDYSLRVLEQPGGLWATFNGTWIEIFNNSEFFMQGFLNYIAWKFFDSTYVPLLVTNAFVGALAGVIVYAYFKRLFNARVAGAGFLIASLYPAAINFSFFGLRDILQYFFILWNACAWCWLILRPDHKALNIGFYIATFAFVILGRLAYLPFLLVLPGWVVFRWMLTWASLPRRFEVRTLVAGILGVAIPAAGLAAMYVAYVVVLQKLHITSVESLSDVADKFSDWRIDSTGGGFAGSGAYLAAGHGSGSDILPHSLFHALPFPVRAFVQISAMFIIPVPWQLTAADRLLAAFDTVFVLTATVWAWRAPKLLPNFTEGPLRSPFSDPNSRMRIVLWGLFLAYLASAAGMGLFNTNSGNAFRLRLSMEPFIIMGASIYAAYRVKLPKLFWQEIDAPSPVPQPAE